MSCHPSRSPAAPSAARTSVRRVSKAVEPPDTTPAGTLVVVLAAGAGSRFTGPQHKLLTALPDGMPLAQRSINAAIASGVGPVVVVTGAVDIGRPTGIARLDNPRWRDGQATSLQIAIAEGGRRRVDALVIGLADQPLVGPEAWRRVAASTSPIAVATYTDSGPDAPRNPVRLHRTVWPLLPTDGDRGAREVIRSRPDLVERVPCPGSAADVDRLEDLTELEQRWQNNSSTNSS